MGQPGRDGSASLGKRMEDEGQMTLSVFALKHVWAALSDLSVSLPASTPSEDLSSGDAMGMNKTGTLGPADKDRRSKKKLVNYIRDVPIRIFWP